MAYLHQFAPRASEVALNDFETGEPGAIVLDLSRPALAVAQKFYKRRWVKGNGYQPNQF